MKIDISDIEKYIFYIKCFIILVTSFCFSYFLQINEIFKGLVAFPGALSLLVVLYKSWKDEYLQDKQQDFILGTASHMAEVSYNKHISFCEEYIERIEKGRQELFRDGPSRNCLKIGRELVNIRQKHSTWLTREIENKLKPFEQALIEIGANEGLLDNLPIGEQRNEVIKHVYKTFGLIIGHETTLNEKEVDLKIDEVIEKIRDILGINVLTRLRLKATDLSSKRLGS